MVNSSILNAYLSMAHRFQFYLEWLENCKTCTEWALVTDSRDVIFQADPFKDLHKPAKDSPHDLFVYGEYGITVSHWFAKVPIERCYDLKEVKFVSWQDEDMLCSGGTIGNREGMTRCRNCVCVCLCLCLALSVV
jgi:hypothetical protein